MKLTREQQKEIFRDIYSGSETISSASRKYNISKSSILSLYQTKARQMQEMSEYYKIVLEVDRMKERMNKRAKKSET